MFTGEDIEELVELFERRGAKLYHACQLTDFQSYLDVGGIPSRGYLESSDCSFTPFETDNGDREKSVWDKVFLNMSDFGTTFATGGNGVPNPYGPILIQLHPKALLEASDVAICLRSAGARDFSREDEALETVDEVNRLFSNSSDSKMKYGAALQEEFGVDNARDPEMSCSVESGKLSIEHTSLVRVDPYIVNQTSLIHEVKKCLTSRDYRFRVFERSHYKEGRKELLAELTELLLSDPSLSLDNLVELKTCSNGLREWAEQLRDRNLGWNFDRYAQYLRSGTLVPLANALLACDDYS